MEDVASPASQQEEHEADRRARELFHYFQPDNPALLPASQGTDPHGSTCAYARASPNLVLTALAQLAAVKVGVQRAIIRYVVDVLSSLQHDGGARDRATTSSHKPGFIWVSTAKLFPA